MPARFLVDFASGYGFGMFVVLVDHVTEIQDDIVCLNREVRNRILCPCRPEVRSEMASKSTVGPSARQIGLELDSVIRL